MKAIGWWRNGSNGTNPFTAQILVQNAIITINNIGVDANNVASSCLAVGRWIGIAYQSGSGTIKNLAIRNGAICGDSSAIFADTTNLKITNNSLHDCIDYINLVAAANTTVSGNAVIQGTVVFLRDARPQRRYRRPRAPRRNPGPSSNANFQWSW